MHNSYKVGQETELHFKLALSDKSKHVSFEAVPYR